MDCPIFCRQNQLLNNVTAKFNAQGAPSTLSFVITVERSAKLCLFLR